MVLGNVNKQSVIIFRINVILQYVIVENKLLGRNQKGKK